MNVRFDHSGPTLQNQSASVPGLPPSSAVKDPSALHLVEREVMEKDEISDEHLSPDDAKKPAQAIPSQKRRRVTRACDEVGLQCSSLRFRSWCTACFCLEMPGWMSILPLLAERAADLCQRYLSKERADNFL